MTDDESSSNSEDWSKLTQLQACKDPSLNIVFDLKPYFDSSIVQLARWWSPDLEWKVDAMLRSVIDWWHESLMGKRRS
ncbi:hypothetical protein Dimus_009572 [Dionaea muscipula]